MVLYYYDDNIIYEDNVNRFIKFILTAKWRTNISWKKKRNEINLNPETCITSILQ
jgi:hypothetical protein